MSVKIKCMHALGKLQYFSNLLQGCLLALNKTTDWCLVTVMKSSHITGYFWFCECTVFAVHWILTVHWTESNEQNTKRRSIFRSWCRANYCASNCILWWISHLSHQMKERTVLNQHFLNSKWKITTFLFYDESKLSTLLLLLKWKFKHILKATMQTGCLFFCIFKNIFADSTCIWNFVLTLNIVYICFCNKLFVQYNTVILYISC